MLANRDTHALCLQEYNITSLLKHLQRDTNQLHITKCLWINVFLKSMARSNQAVLCSSSGYWVLMGTSTIKKQEYTTLLIYTLPSESNLPALHKPDYTLWQPI